MGSVLTPPLLREAKRKTFNMLKKRYTAVILLIIAQIVPNIRAENDADLKWQEYAKTIFPSGFRIQGEWVDSNTPSAKGAEEAESKLKALEAKVAVQTEDAGNKRSFQDLIAKARNAAVKGGSKTNSFVASVTPEATILRKFDASESSPSCVEIQEGPINKEVNLVNRTVQVRRLPEQSLSMDVGMLQRLLVTALTTKPNPSEFTSTENHELLTLTRKTNGTTERYTFKRSARSEPLTRTIQIPSAGQEESFSFENWAEFEGVRLPTILTYKLQSSSGALEKTIRIKTVSVGDSGDDGKDVLKDDIFEVTDQRMEPPLSYWIRQVFPGESEVVEMAADPLKLRRHNRSLGR